MTETSWGRTRRNVPICVFAAAICAAFGETALRLVNRGNPLINPVDGVHGLLRGGAVPSLARDDQVPAVGGHAGRVSGGNDPHMQGKPEVANGFFEHNPQHGGLYRGRGGGELVKK